jgi:solute carrier family 39 (zinc transporter), member 9
MDETLTLILLSLAMLIGCYLAGSVPLAFTMSEEKLKLVTVLGAGLLVGTALAVIIPEGVHALLFPPEQAHHPLAKSAQALSRTLKAAVNEDVLVPDKLVEHAHEHHDHEAHDHEHHDHGTELHSWIGVALVLGFVFMLLVDQIGGSIHSRTSGDSSGRNRITATLGLVVHAAADGIALGAAASTSQMHVEMIVFVAIMLHKAPAAFGLVSFLMHEGFDRNRIRRHLLIFALSAPVLAIVTYFGLSQRSKEVLSDINATGIAMLFSGGTFLYVATVHILPELARFGVQTQTALPDTVIAVHEHRGFSKTELVVMVIGCILPLILALGHRH